MKLVKSMKPISRRTLLRGAGASIALPMLDAMMPRQSWAQDGMSSKRLIVWIMCGGAHQPSWEIGGSTSAPTVGQALQPLAEANLIDELTLVTGTHNDFVDRRIGHGPCSAALLTGVKPEKEEIRASISMDQVVASHLAGLTPIPSLQLGTSPTIRVSNDGYPPSYNHLFSWANETTQLPNITEPAAAFEKLFGGIDNENLGSVLDVVLEDANRLNAKLGASDRARLEQYFTYIRDLETRLQNSGSGVACGVSPNPGIPRDAGEHIRAMNDIMVLAGQCDATRVMTFVYDSSATSKDYSFMDLPGGYHNSYQHHSGDPVAQAGYTEINRWIVEQYADFITKMKTTTDPTGASLLDGSAAMLCSEMGEGNGHRTLNLPCIIAGRAGGAISSGRHIATNSEPMANVHIGLMQAMGVPIDTFGLEGTRALPGLLS